MPSTNEDDTHENESKNLDAKVQLLIAAEVERRVAKEIGFWRETAGSGLKILTYAVGALVGLLTILGYSTLKDIHREVSETVKGSIEEKIKSSNSELGVIDYENQLVDRTLLSASINEVYTHRMPQLSRSEIKRLVSLLSKSETSIDDFRDAIHVLDNVDVNTKSELARGVLTELLRAADDHGFSWMAIQSEKRIIILDGFVDRELTPTVSNMTSVGNTGRVRRSALEFLSRAGANEYFKHLRYSVRYEEDDTVRPTLQKVTLSMAPTLEEAESLVKDLTSTSRKHFNGYDAFAAAADLMTRPRVLLYGADKTKIEIRLLQYGAANETTSFYDSIPSDLFRRVLPRDYMNVYQGITFADVAFLVPDFGNVLTALLDQGDVKTFGAMLGVGSREVALIADVVIGRNAKLTVTLDDGTSRYLGPEAKLVSIVKNRVYWTDVDGDVREGKLSEASGPFQVDLRPGRLSQANQIFPWHDPRVRP